MTIELVKELWDGLKPIIQRADHSEAAETLINLLIDNDFDTAEIKEMFRRDQAVMDALKFFSQDDETEYEEEEEEYEEDQYYDDEDY
jgi:hypothetical protein